MVLLKRTILVYMLVWFALVADWIWFRKADVGFVAGETIVEILYWIVFSLGVPLAVASVHRSYRSTARTRRELPFALTLAYLVIWQWIVFATNACGFAELRGYAARIGTILWFFVGLGWAIHWIDEAAYRFECRRRSSDTVTRRIWNPLDLEAWYYGKRGRKLNQSLAGFISYTMVFMVGLFLLTGLRGCQEVFEMPAGGGQQQTITQQVKIQKIIKKKFVINPTSLFSFKVPPIDEVKLNLTEATKHAYTVGYGEGTGAGYAGGTKAGRVRFIRLEYQGGDWDQDFGIGADLNMLIEYGIRTQQKVAQRTESRTIQQVNNTPLGGSPPFVYMTGQRNIVLSTSEVKALREYLLDKHGMVFGDNGGSGQFHTQFVAMMRRVLPNVRPVPVPLDDQIHRVPFAIPFLPFVAPHGGREALGWKVDGRWVAYYHPGDIGDAWTDDHSGVSPEVYEACYQLGANVINYAYAEYSKWSQSRLKSR